MNTLIKPVDSYRLYSRNSIN